MVNSPRSLVIGIHTPRNIDIGIYDDFLKRSLVAVAKIATISVNLAVI